MAVKFPEQPNKSQGTAFLISLEDGGYAVTCHHVIGKHSRVELYFQPTEQSIQAEFIPDHSDAGMDIAILKLLEARPTELQMLHLSSEDCAGREFESFGFPQEFNGLIATGKVKGLVPPPAKAPRAPEGGLLQLSTTDVVKGMSGAPVVLKGTEQIVGMVVAGNNTQWNTHSDLAFAQTIEAVQKLCRDLIPDNPIESREEWIKFLGFRPDPFLYTDGGNDPYLLEYLCPVPNLLDILGDVSRPETVLVFGTAGSGKSSLRNAVAQMCRNDGALPIIYRDFGLLVDKLQRDQPIQVNDHVARILRVAIGAVFAEVQKGSIPSHQFDRDNEVLRRCLWSYVSKYEDDHVRKQKLNYFLELDGDVSKPLPADYRDLVGYFCRYVVALFNYKSIYFLVDPDEDIASDVELAWQVLEPLLSAQRLLELSSDGAAFKFFLNQDFSPQASQIHWVSKEQGRRIYPKSLEWSEDRLRELLKRRLKACSERTPPYDKLEALSEVKGLDDVVIRHSGSEPRRLITICHKLFSVHCQLPIDRDRPYITREEVDEAFAQLGITEPESKLTKLITQRESGFVEFKSTMRYNLHTKQRDEKLERAIAKTLCGFMNAEGGTLVIGVDDDGNVLGLDNDFSTLRKKDEDGFELAFTGLVTRYLELPDRRYVSLNFEDYDSRKVCFIEIERSQEPIFCLFDQKYEFHLRVGNSTRQLDAKWTLEYGKDRF